MRIYEGIKAFQKPSKAVVTMGIFDGVHLGHQQLLRLLRAQAQEINGETVLLTFWPHPRLVLAHTHPAPIQLLTSLEEKAALLAQQGVDHLVILQFTPAFAQLSAQAFVQQVLVGQLGIRHILVGHDHRFGKGRAGDVALLKAIGSHEDFTVTEVPPVMVDHITISSTKIRQLLLAGAIEQAKAYLGQPYAMKCIVGQGNAGTGEGLLLTPSSAHQLIPANGLYQVQVTYQKTVCPATLHITYKQAPTLALTAPALAGGVINGASLILQFST